MLDADCLKHAALRGRGSAPNFGSAMNGSAATRTGGDTAVILAGVRAVLWLDAGTGRAASTALIGGLCADHGTEAVLCAAIDVCRTRPPRPKAWLRHACRQHSSQFSQPIQEEKNHDHRHEQG